MAREIDLLVQAARGPYLVVEKATNVLWNLDELQEADRTGRYQGEDRVAPADERDSAVSGPFPGCLQQMSAPEELTRRPLLGQTRHFLLFGSQEG
jgi:hypothetical protein